MNSLRLLLCFFLCLLSTNYVYASVPEAKTELQNLIQLTQQSIPNAEAISQMSQQYETQVAPYVKEISPRLNTKTQEIFAQLMVADKNQNATQAKALWQELNAQLTSDFRILNAKPKASFFETFFQSLMILLREGFEAMLIVAALLAYLRKAHLQKHNSVVYTGAISAIGASFLTAYLFNTLLSSLSMYREALEGITMLVAAGVLFYVSYWLFSQGQNRKKVLNEKVERAISSGSMFMLGLVSFLAVYREGAEIILFYQALLVSVDGPVSGFISGAVGALGLLGVLYLVMKYASFKIPFRLFFSVTAVFLYYMAFCFIGGGVSELQDGGLISSTQLNWLPEIEWLGIHPTWESTSMQTLFLIPAIIGLWWWYQKNHASS